MSTPNALYSERSSEKHAEIGNSAALSSNFLHNEFETLCWKKIKSLIYSQIVNTDSPIVKLANFISCVLFYVHKMLSLLMFANMKFASYARLLWFIKGTYTNCSVC